jgi:hypothetical protein
VVLEAVIADMIAARAAQVLDNTSLDDLWSRGVRSAGSISRLRLRLFAGKARAGAWITAWWPVCDLRDVPRVVSEGWTFESYPPDYSPVVET